MTKTGFYDDPVAWEFFEEIEDFTRDLRRYGFVDLKHDNARNDDRLEQAHWDAWMFASAVAEQPYAWPWSSHQERSRGPGRRVRDRYWDKRERA